MTFQDMNISEDILLSLKRMNFVTMTPVQKETITPVAEGKDVVVLAPTGSGKTAAFGIPILENLDTGGTALQALILCPTRELALQTVEVFHELTAHKKGVRVQALYGGEPIERQIKALKKRPQVIVSTPGRLIDHMNRRTVRLDSLRTVVLDEADRMLDMGFSRDMKIILDATPKTRQTILFSATMPPEIMRIAEKYQRNAQRISVGGAREAVDSVTQYYAEVDAHAKEATLVKLLRERRYGLALVFVSRKHLAKKLAKTLAENHFRAAALQGNMSQPQRNRVMGEYRNGELDVLVATDVAARGIDVNNIDVVVNFDLPQDPDSYIHRVGRTGRADQRGDSYTLISPKESYDFRDIIKKTNSKVQLVRLGIADDFIARKVSRANVSDGRGASRQPQSRKTAEPKTRRTSESKNRQTADEKKRLFSASQKKRYGRRRAHSV